MNTSMVRNDVTSSEYTSTQDADVVPLDKERVIDAPKYPSDKAHPHTPDHGRRVNPHYGIDY